MAVNRKALDNVHMYPRGVQSVLESFYVDDRLTGAGSIEEALYLQKQLHRLFLGAAFTLRKWKTNEPNVLAHVTQELKDQKPSQAIEGREAFAKVLGLGWNANLGVFHPMVADCVLLMKGTAKRCLLSNIARVYDYGKKGWDGMSMSLLKSWRYGRNGVWNCQY